MGVQGPHGPRTAAAGDRALTPVLVHITPSAPAAERPCWHCQRFGGLVYQDTAARCLREAGVAIVAQPRYGCAFWVREPGSDDEPGPPSPSEAANRTDRQASPVDGGASPRASSNCPGSSRPGGQR